MDLPYDIWLDSYNNLMSVEHVLKNATFEFWAKNFSPHRYGQSGLHYTITTLHTSGSYTIIS